MAKGESTGPPCRGKDVGGFPKEGISALNSHAGSEKFCYSSPERRMYVFGQLGEVQREMRLESGQEPSQKDL